MADHSDIPEQDEPFPVSDNTNSWSTEFDDLHATSEEPVDDFAKDSLNEFAEDSPDEFEDDLETDVTPDYSPLTHDEPTRPFVGLGENQGRMMQEIRHRMRDMERRLQDKLARRNRPTRFESREQSRTSSRTRYSHSFHRRRSISASSSRSRSPRSRSHATYRKRSPSPRRRTRSPHRRKENREHVITGQTPFTATVLQTRLPKNFDKPTDLKYDGTTDPQDHLDAFEARMNLEGFSDVIRCKEFPVTLKGAAMTDTL
ncbi:hypothetical protein PIB30_035755 [Stylosanthes scabra]|uniref:Reverse transcriptase domain-containing protein n=1 Tax=Stylosanthes scabra TaxID=79078 RepID=A0ABU6RDC2_9FABA|nr:hypothetical protein [Stylosanthes scabra]